MYFFVPTVITHISSINILEPQRSSRVGMSNGFVHDWQRRDDELSICFHCESAHHNKKVQSFETRHGL